jgi:signal peptidase I
VTVREKSGANQLIELVLIIAVAIGLALLIQAFLVKPYRIPSESMEPTLDVGQRVLVNRIGERFTDPKVGDIVVFHPPAGADTQDGSQCGAEGQGLGTSTPCARPTAAKSSQSFIKRVVGVGGDTIAIRGGHVIRNGKAAGEPFTARCDGDVCDFDRSIVIPKGSVYVMGDNRGDSDDSRFWGPVPLDWVIGKAFATYWPPSRIGGAG